jgi:hypothetical protein
VDPSPRVRGWPAAFGGDEEARWFAPRVAVRLLRTQRPTPKEYDSWAHAPMSEAGPLLSAEMKRCGGSLLAWWFTFSAHGGQRPRSMTLGPEPPCQRLGRLGARRASFSAASRGVSGGVLLKKGFPECGSHSHHSLRPFAHMFSALFCRRSRHGLARPSRVLPVRGGTQLGAQPAQMGSAGVRRKDPCRRLSSQRSRRRGVRALRLQPPLRVGAANLVFLRAAAGGARPSTSAHHAPLHPLGGHYRLPLQDVHGGDTSSSSIRTKGCCAATFWRREAS